MTPSGGLSLLPEWLPQTHDDPAIQEPGPQGRGLSPPRTSGTREAGVV